MASYSTKRIATCGANISGLGWTPRVPDLSTNRRIFSGTIRKQAKPHGCVLLTSRQMRRNSQTTAAFFKIPPCPPCIRMLHTATPPSGPDSAYDPRCPPLNPESFFWKSSNLLVVVSHPPSLGVWGVPSWQARRPGRVAAQLASLREVTGAGGRNSRNPVVRNEMK